MENIFEIDGTSFAVICTIKDSATKEDGLYTIHFKGEPIKTSEKMFSFTVSDYLEGASLVNIDELKSIQIIRNGQFNNL